MQVEPQDNFVAIASDFLYQIRRHKAIEHPALFAKEILGIVLWPKQIEICDAIMNYREVFVHSAFGVGKSMTASILVAWHVCRYGSKGQVVTTAPTDRQVKSILWDAIRKFAKNAHLPGRILSKEWKIGVRGKEDILVAMGIVSQDYRVESFQGIHEENVMVIFDEAPGISEPIWNASDALLTSSNCRFLAIGNPRDSTDIFHSKCTEKEDYRKVIRINALETPNYQTLCVTDEMKKELPQLPFQVGDVLYEGFSGAVDYPQTNVADQNQWKTQALVELKRIFDAQFELEKKYKIKMPYPGLSTPFAAYKKLRQFDVTNPEIETGIFGLFPLHQDDTCIPYAWIVKAQERHEHYMQLMTTELDPENILQSYLKQQRVAEISVDPAWSIGGNETVISVRVGKIILRVMPYTGIQTGELVFKLREECNRLNSEGYKVANIRVDEPGIGLPTIEILRKSEPAFPTIIAVNTGTRPRNTRRYYNLRAELWYGALRDALDPNGSIQLALPPERDLASQLAIPKMSYTLKGQVRVETKDEIRDRVGKEHADIGRADSIVLLAAPPDAMPDFKDLFNEDQSGGLLGEISIFKR